jgi:hypothetical protein
MAQTVGQTVRALLSTDAFSAVLLASCGSITTSNDSDNVLMGWLSRQVSASFHTDLFLVDWKPLISLVNQLGLFPSVPVAALTSSFSPKQTRVQKR